MFNKKTLITKLPIDVSLMSDAQIAACQAYMTASFAREGTKAEFEVITEEITYEDFIAMLNKQTAQRVARILGVPEETAAEPAAESDEQPMQTVELINGLDESQSKVLRGFFAARPSDEPPQSSEEPG